MDVFRLVGESERSQWDQHVASYDFVLGNFLQSWSWGEFQAATQKKVYRVVLEEDGTWKMSAQIIELGLPFNQKIFYIPRGPLFFSKEKKELFHLFLNGLKEISKKEKILFLRIDPPWPRSQMNDQLLYSLHFKKSWKNIQPADTIVIDLDRLEQEVLFGFKPKTRYNIRVAQRHGIITTIASADSQEEEAFFKILTETAARDHFFIHALGYYRTMLRMLEKEEAVHLFVAKKDDTVVAGAIVSFFQGVATYLHGASSWAMRSYMGPYLLHWDIICQAKKRGCARYDLNGVGTHRNWAGFSRFKQGFAPMVDPVSVTGTWEYPYEGVLYGLYWLRDRFIHYISR